MNTHHICCINTATKEVFHIEEASKETLAKKLFIAYNKAWNLHFCKTKQIRLEENNTALSCIRYCYSDQSELTYEQANKIYLKQIKEM